MVVDTICLGTTGAVRQALLEGVDEHPSPSGDAVPVDGRQVRRSREGSQKPRSSGV